MEHGKQKEKNKKSEPVVSIVVFYKNTDNEHYSNRSQYFFYFIEHLKKYRHCSADILMYLKYIKNFWIIL
jgi:hypothetical protein